MEDLPLQGDALRNRLKELGMTQTDLAISLGVSTQAVQHWVAGRTAPNARLVPKLIDVLQLEVESEADNERLVRVEDAINQLRGDVTEIAALLRQLVRQQLDAAAAEPATPTVRRRKKSR